MNQKGFINIILIVVVIILIGIVGCFVLVKKSAPIFSNERPSSSSEQPANNLKKYSNILLGIEFSYPKNFIPYLRDHEYIGDQPSRFTSGNDSYAPMYDNASFLIDAAGGKGSYNCPSSNDPKMSYSGSYDAIQKFIQEGKPIKFENCKEIISSIDQIAENSAYHKLRPFGENPVITKLQIEGQEARTIIPSDPKYDEAELIVRLKKPASIVGTDWVFMVIYFSKGSSK